MPSSDRMGMNLSEPGLGAGDSLATPFEDWCGAHGIHPEAFGAWERFEATVRQPVTDTRA